MKIVIVGAAREGKTLFLDTVLYPALLRQNKHGFKIHDGGVEVARLKRDGKHHIEVWVTNSVEEAETFLRGGK